MVTKFYFVDDAYSPDFCEAMEELGYEIECYIEAVDHNEVLVECDERDLAVVEEYLAPFV